MSIPDVGCFTFNVQDLFLHSGKQILIVLNVSPPGEEEYADVACGTRGRWLFLGLLMLDSGYWILDVRCWILDPYYLFFNLNSLFFSYELFCLLN